MGLGRFELEFLLHEHRYSPITGDVLTIGKQAISLSPARIVDLLGFYGITPRTQTFEFDTSNDHNFSGSPSVSDKSLFATFSDCRLQAADISSYEGAEHVFDICDTVPDDLIGKFDFVTDGGSLDNVFDPFRMLANMTRMLKPGGRLFIFAWGNSFPTAYLKVSPDWLMDYCAVNEFEDCKVYALEYPPLARPWFKPSWMKLRWTMWHYDPYVVNEGGIGYECSSIKSQMPALVYCIAQKGARTTPDRGAIQKHYRGGNIEPYLTSMIRFRDSNRPIFTSPTGQKRIDVAPISPYATVRPVATWLERARMQ